MIRDDFSILFISIKLALVTPPHWPRAGVPSSILARGPQHFLSRFVRPRLLSDADSREGVEQPKYVEEPQHYADDHDCVQDGLDAARHGDEAIHQPQQDAHDDQG
jgi:hypothetical protein